MPNLEVWLARCQLCACANSCSLDSLQKLNNGFILYTKLMSYRVSYELYKDFDFSEEAELVEGVAELPGCDHFGWTSCIPHARRVSVM